MSTINKGVRAKYRHHSLPNYGTVQTQQTVPPYRRHVSSYDSHHSAFVHQQPEPTKHPQKIQPHFSTSSSKQHTFTNQSSTNCRTTYGTTFTSSSPCNVTSRHLLTAGVGQFNGAWRHSASSSVERPTLSAVPEHDAEVTITRVHNRICYSSRCSIALMRKFLVTSRGV